MKLLVLTNMYPSAEEPWAGSFVKEQADSLVECGLSVTIENFDGRVDWKEYLHAGTRVRRIVSSRDFDLVHAHFGLTGAVAVAQRRVPVVTTFHGSDTMVPWQRGVSFIVARMTTPIFVSKAGRHCLRSRQSAVIACGVDLKRFRPRPSEEARCQLGWDLDAKYVLFPSRPATSVKRVDVFNAVVKEARATVPGLRAVTLEGFDREHAALAFSAADVTLMTSDREGAPVTVKESIACNTPVVSVPVGDVPCVIDGLPGCSIHQRDERDLAAGVVRAIRAGRSDELRHRAEEFSLERVAKRLCDIYEHAIRRSERAAWSRRSEWAS
jgi:glycosyltransferase involved in cell wall biosynthesis